MYRVGQSIAFMGDSDHADYHSPLGSEPEALLAKFVSELEKGVRLSFDSLPVEASTPIAGGLVGSGLETNVAEQVVAMVLELPSSIDGYLEMIGKKNRHELARKRRRYEELIGPVAHQTHVGLGFGFDEFVRLHRLSPGDKGQFMTGRRLAFFSALAAQSGWRVDLLVRGDRATSAVFGWADGHGYYLYNSSFDPDLQAGSPGLVLLLEMIEHSIAQKWGRFDFLKGDEPYKARLGARPRQLYRIEAVT
jgi:CelD/BcsL family acetyltransferase involved in cellulose biosynthesis